MSNIYDEIRRIAKIRNISVKHIAEDEIGLSWETIRKWDRFEPSDAHRRKVLKWLGKQKVESSLTLSLDMASADADKETTEAPIIEEKEKVEIPDEFWQQLKIIYENHPEGKENWLKEKDLLGKIVKQISYAIAPKYKIESPIQYGGTSVILKVTDTMLKNTRALKFPRPIEGREELFVGITQSEIAHLLEAVHINIIEIYSHDKVLVEGVEYPFYIMKHIENAKDGLEFFTSQKATATELINVLIQIAEGIRHLHSLDIVHLDIKPENFLISSDGYAVLTDLGSAHKTIGEMEDVTVVYTRNYAHPELISKKYTSTTDPNRLRGTVKRSELRKEFDIFAFGRSILRLLKNFDPVVTTRMPPYTRKYLHLLACRNLDGRNEESETERALALPRSAFDELKYKDISEILDDLMKLTGEYRIEKYVPETDRYISQTIQTSSQWRTPLTDRLVKTIGHYSLKRLAGISQLGMLVQVYPTATHSRLEHTLGVFTNIVQYVMSLYNDPINPLFKQIMTPYDITAVLVAALCHDIGYYPLAHDLHEALPEVFSHEQIALDILAGQKDWIHGKSLREIILKEWGIQPQYIADILKADPTNTDQPIKTRILHTLLDGPIDADKLDYLVRDSRNLGVPYASNIDFNRLLGCLTIIFKELDRKLHVALGIHEKGKISAESIAFARYAMFGTVYWHHTSRASKSMLHRALWEMAQESYSKRNGIRILQKDFTDRFIKTERLEKIEFGIPTGNKIPLNIFTQLLSSDREVLQWISDKTSSAGSELIQMLNERQLFKRILVLSEKRKGPLWDILIKYRKKSNGREMISLDNEIQKRIVDSVSKLDDSKRRLHSILTSDNTDQVINMHEKGQIITIIDIPTDRPGSKTALEYLPEADRQDVLQQWKLPSSLEDSVVWKELSEKFIESVGKIRLFCHPAVAEIIMAAIERKQLEDMVESSVQYLQK